MIQQLPLDSAHRQPPPASVPNVLSIAGLDPTAGAGLLADLKTFTALGVNGCGVVTGLTAQNSQRLSRVESVSGEFFAAQLQDLCADLPLAALKTGMLASQAVLEALLAALQSPALGLAICPLVVDPVLKASSGGALLDPSAQHMLRDQLLPSADLITPNLPEALALLNYNKASLTAADLPHVLEDLQRLSGAAVLLKGGHMLKGGRIRDAESVFKAARAEDDGQVVDWFYDGEIQRPLAGPYVPNGPFRGTGCALSAAICAYLALGYPLLTAVTRAKQYLNQALAKSPLLSRTRRAGLLWQPSFALADRSNEPG